MKKTWKEINNLLNKKGKLNILLLKLKDLIMVG
jgi:hypothetical protein